MKNIPKTGKKTRPDSRLVVPTREIYEAASDERNAAADRSPSEEMVLPSSHRVGTRDYRNSCHRLCQLGSLSRHFYNGHFGLLMCRDLIHLRRLRSRALDYLMKTIAIDLDDTLNNFTETLQRTEFARDETHALSEETFQDYLAKVRCGRTESNGLLCTEYSFFRARIHRRCYELAQARSDGVRFTQWLRQNGWRIVICTRRDLRTAQDCTRRFLAENEIPFDYLFMTRNKIGLCKAWRIEHLIDDDPINIELGERFGVNVYYPAAAGGRDRKSEVGGLASDLRPLASDLRLPARPFHTFDEIRPWIQE
jgi:hypothetical protein